MLKRFTQKAKIAIIGAVLGAMAFGVGCTGGDSTGWERTRTTTYKAQIAPVALTLLVGQSQQFSVSAIPGGVTTWRVVPAESGTVSTSGLFTAQTPGVCVVEGIVTSGNIRCSATADVRILPPQAAAASTPNLVQGSGAQQGSGPVSGPGSVANAAVVNEAIPSVSSESPDRFYRVRHGFNLSVK